MRKTLITLFVIITINSLSHGSGTFPLDNLTTPFIGINKTHEIKGEETLIDLAREYDLGYNEIIAANTGIDPWIPDPGTDVVIPTKWILPESLDKGILINLAEMRLYYFFWIDKKKYIKTFPIGIGRQGLQTPTGLFKISRKVKDPVWNVPESIRKENPDLPASVPPGPHNPLGGYWLELSDGYGIHGTNRPYGIGRKVSHGCIRLYPEDIKILFDHVGKDVTVKIVDKPVKAAFYNNRIYIEVHRAGLSNSELVTAASRELSRKRLMRHINIESLIKEVKNATGLPAPISQ